MLHTVTVGTKALKVTKFGLMCLPHLRNLKLGMVYLDAGLSKRRSLLRGRIQGATFTKKPSMLR